MDIEGIRRSMRAWFDAGAQQGHRFLLVWQDNFDAMDGDFGLYPEYADDIERARSAIDNRTNPFDRLMEILDLRGDYTEQINGPARRSMDHFTETSNSESEASVGDKRPDPVLSGRFGDALTYALECHRHQVRKGTRIPYMAHLLQVCGIVLEAGGDEEQAIAALLHDAIEDAPGGRADRVREDIRSRFGERVLAIVEACTDTDEQPKPPWHERREAYLAHLSDVHPDALLVSAADKLHNAGAILRDVRELGDELWGRFAGGRDGTLWYYRELVEAYRVAGSVPFLDMLDEVVAAIEREAQDADS